VSPWPFFPARVRGPDWRAEGHSPAQEGWLAAVEADDQPGLRSFAAGIRHDQQAVTNGLTLPWNSGKVEGTVNKIILWNQNCQIGPA
jgi:transposase